MTIYVIFGIFLAIVCYITASGYIMRARESEFNMRRRELLDLYVKRANLMPIFLAAARHMSPIPGDLYNRFLNAREVFAKATPRTNLNDANAELNAVFDKFFAHYAACREPLYIKTREDYDALQEKINFTSSFYQLALTRYHQAQSSPLRHGARLVRVLIDRT